MECIGFARLDFVKVDIYRDKKFSRSFKKIEFLS